MRKRWLLVPALIGVGLISAAGSALAYSVFSAVQTGSHPWGASESSRLTIRVEAGMDADQVFVPDSPSCGNPVAGVAASPGCQGGSLVFSIENQSEVPLRVAAVSQGTISDGVTSNCRVLSDKYEDGSFATGLTCTRLSVSIASCAADVAFAAPNLNVNGGARPWPIIPPHGTLQVNGTDNNQLGLGMIHLNSVTPPGCEGANFYIPLLVSALDAT